MSHTLLKKIIVRGKIEALTGIAIGGTNNAMGIGGVDKGVIRNPVTYEPYIPGSSLKGKMRSLLELTNGSIGGSMGSGIENGPSLDYAHRSTKLFGNAVRSQQETQRPSRIIVRDAYLLREQVNSDFFKNADLLYTEVKTEVVIDRITSRAMPRQLERVPAGAKFDFELVLNVFAEDNAEHLVNDMFAALQLVQNDYVGGSGSRGSGQIRFDIETVSERDANYYRNIGQITDANVTETYRAFFPR